MTRILKYFGAQLCLHSAEAHCTDVCDRALIRTNKRTVSYNDNGTCFSLVVVSVGNAEEKCHLPLLVEKLSRSNPCCASSQRGVFVCNLWHIHLVSKKSVQENTSKVPKLHTRDSAGSRCLPSVFFFFLPRNIPSANDRLILPSSCYPTWKLPFVSLTYAST